MARWGGCRFGWRGFVFARNEAILVFVVVMFVVCFFVMVMWAVLSPFGGGKGEEIIETRSLMLDASEGGHQ